MASCTGNSITEKGSGSGSSLRRGKIGSNDGASSQLIERLVIELSYVNDYRLLQIVWIFVFTKKLMYSKSMNHSVSCLPTLTFHATKEENYTLYDALVAAV